jgi:hypothetical protein
MNSLLFFFSTFIVSGAHSIGTESHCTEKLRQIVAPNFDQDSIVSHSKNDGSAYINVSVPVIFESCGKTHGWK